MGHGNLYVYMYILELHILLEKVKQKAAGDLTKREFLMENFSINPHWQRKL